jgi:hypothetical protein
MTVYGSPFLAISIALWFLESTNNNIKPRKHRFSICANSNFVTGQRNLDAFDKKLHMRRGGMFDSSPKATYFGCLKVSFLRKFFFFARHIN